MPTAFHASSLTGMPGSASTAARSQMALPPSGAGAVVEVGGEGGVAASSHLPAQRRVGGEQRVAVQFGAGVVEAGDAAPDVAWLRGVSFGLDHQVADDADAFAGPGVLEGDPGRAHGVDLADGWPV